MAFTYTTIDGQRVETHVAAAYANLKAGFERAFPGLSLVISSATRTRAEQEAIFRARYTTTPGSRRVYDTRIWNGVKWYRISAEGTVAVPGTSNHEDDGPIGPRAIDIRDTGGDAGVMTRGTVRDNWMAAHAGEYGFSNAGYNFGEPWHKEFTGSLDDNSGGGDWSDGQKQDFLNSLGYNTGAPGWGPLCASATKDFQTRSKTLVADGQFGPATTGVAKLIVAGEIQVSRPVTDIQHALNTKGFPAGPEDGKAGNKTYFGVYLFQGANGLAQDCKYGPKSDAALFPTVPPVTPPPTPDDPNKLDPNHPWTSQTPDSKLATWIGSPNYNYRTPAAVKDWIVVHWFGSDANLAGTDAHFQDPGTIVNGLGTGASSNYGIGADGTRHQYVLEKDYVHTNGATEPNARALTFEHEGGPGKPITDACYASSIELIAERCQARGIKKLVLGVNYFPHNHFVATQCPGTLDLQRIMNGVNAIIAPDPVVPPEPPVTPDTIVVDKSDLLATQALLNKVISEGH